jgi:hypothetical protein
MEEYGYMYNKLSKDVKKFSTKPVLNIKNTENNDYSVYLLVTCIILFIIVAKYS